MEVKVINGNLERALRIFRKQLERDGTVRRAKERNYGYDKPSTKKKRKHRAALQRIKRREKRGAFAGNR